MSIFHRHNQDKERLIAVITRALGSTTELHDLLEQVSAELAQTFRAEHVSVFVYASQSKGRQFTGGTPGYKRLPLHDTALLDQYVQAHHFASIVVSRQLDDQLRRVLVSHHIAVVVPLVLDGATLGYILLGKAPGGYSRQDVTMLTVIGSELTIAVQNALSLHALRELNA